MAIAFQRFGEGRRAGNVEVGTFQFLQLVRQHPVEAIGLVCSPRFQAIGDLYLEIKIPDNVFPGAALIFQVVPAGSAGQPQQFNRRRFFPLLAGAEQILHMGQLHLRFPASEVVRI